MESAAKFMCVLASSSLWLAGSGLVLWLCLRSRFQLSPGTRAVASLLIVLQGWIWIGIPVQLDTAWITPQPASIPLQRAAGTTAAREVAAIEAAEAITAPVFDEPLPLDGRLLVSRLPVAASYGLSTMRMAGAASAAIWIAGIVVLVVRSIGGLAALSRIVHALPLAPVAWQNELSELCRKQKISCPLALKVSHVATPMMVQTFGPTCIVVPAWLWESCTADQRTSILLHELAHYRRGDIWRQLAMRLLVLPHWFNPAAWWAARQFEAASEAACDDVACGDDPLAAISYSKALLVLNETIFNERAGLCYAHAVAISGSSLTERIRRILHPEFQKESQMSRLLILSAMGVLTGVATIRIQAADEKAAQVRSVSLLANGG